VLFTRPITYHGDIQTHAGYPDFRVEFEFELTSISCVQEDTQILALSVAQMGATHPSQHPEEFRLEFPSAKAASLWLGSLQDAKHADLTKDDAALSLLEHTAKVQAYLQGDANKPDTPRSPKHFGSKVQEQPNRRAGISIFTHAHVDAGNSIARREGDWEIHPDRTSVQIPKPSGKRGLVGGTVKVLNSGMGGLSKLVHGGLDRAIEVFDKDHEAYQERQDLASRGVVTLAAGKYATMGSGPAMRNQQGEFLPLYALIEKGKEFLMKIPGCVAFAVHQDKGLEFYSGECFGDDGELEEAAGWHTYVYKPQNEN